MKKRRNPKEENKQPSVFDDLEREAEEERRTEEWRRANEKKLARYKPVSDRMQPKENLLDHLFARYCNEHNLTEKEIREFWDREELKSYHNGRELKGGTVKASPSKKKGTGFTKLACYEGDYVCEIPGCQEHTNLVASDLEDSWFIFLCEKHYEEFRAYAGNHPPGTW